jgi:cation diffusion facilitator family transporter
MPAEPADPEADDPESDESAVVTPEPEYIRDLVRIPLQAEDGEGGPDSESNLTVAIAFLANLVIAIAKTGAAILTGSASLVAEAAHSWADSGNEIFLVMANRRSVRPSEPAHPFGFGREAYVWSLFAALGLFVAGAAVSVFHGVQQLFASSEGGDFLIGYIVLAVSFVLEGTSLLQSLRQARPEARSMERDVLEHVLATSDPTLRAVFAEDSAALVGLVIAAVGLALHQITGSATRSAPCSRCPRCPG